MSIASVAVVVLRESLEALLILGVLWGVLAKLGRPEGRSPLLYGALAGLGVSLLLGVAVVQGVQNLSHAAEEAIEGVGALLAVAILTYMVVWMYRHTRQLLTTLQERTQAALEAGRRGALFGLSFVAVAREGFETVVFIGASVPDGAFEVVVGTLAGVAVALGLAVLLFRGVVRLDVRRFFAVTGLLLVVFAAGLLVTGLHELMEIGVLPATPHLWDLSGVLPHGSGVGAVLNAVVGYRADPRLLEALGWVAYVAVMAAWYLPSVAGAVRKVPAPVAEDAP